MLNFFFSSRLAQIFVDRNVDHSNSHYQKRIHPMFSGFNWHLQETDLTGELDFD